MQTNTLPFTFPSIVDLFATRKGGNTILLIGLGLILLQLIFGFIFELDVLPLDGAVVLLPIRLVILCAWGYFIWYNYTSYMQGARFMVWLDLLCTAALTFYLNTVYNKIVRQCFSNSLGCIIDPQYAFSSSWLVLLAPIGLAVSPTRILSLIPTLSLSQSVSIFYGKNKISVLEEVMVVVCGLHWPLYLDGSYFANLLPIDAKWFYIILYAHFVISMVMAWRSRDQQYIQAATKRILMSWPAMVVFVLPTQLRPIMFVPHMILLGRMIYDRIKKPVTTNPVQDMMTQMMSNMMNMTRDPSASPFGAVNMNNIAVARQNTATIERLRLMNNEMVVPTVCENCGSVGAYHKCSQCLKANYCDRRCQQNHWEEHREHCETSLD
jgi:hypothetical protein